MAQKVAIVGAGPLGLLALKNLKEEGFDVTAFERRDYVGGIWQHSKDGIISVNPNTVFNASRFRSAFTDFPFADNVDDYPTCQQMFDYLQNYADHFNLRPSIRLNISAKTMRRVNGKWELTLVANDKETFTEEFDKVVVASGSFQTPKYPEVEGIELFKGDVRHSIDFAPSDQYKDQKVLIVGFHASAVDISSSLAEYASKIYLSRRNGVILLGKFGSDGRTFDQAQNMNFVVFAMLLETYCPRLFWWFMDKVCTSIAKKSFPGLSEKYGLLPAPSLATTTPVAADQIVPHINSGFVEPVLGIRRVTGPKSIELTDGTTLEDVDSIIYCTGYYFDTPFVPDEYNPTPVHGVPPRLYQNIFPLHPDPAVRESLAFMGQGAPPFPGFALFESVAMAVGQIWKGKSHLPSYEDMWAWYQRNLDDYNAKHQRMTTNATHYAVLLPMAPYFEFLDEAAGLGIFKHFSWTSWSSWQFWWNDPELYKTCKTKLYSPAIFRLFDEGKRKAWVGARSQIFHDNEIADRRAEERKAKMEESKKSK